ncbi:MAG: hypothetical protein ACO3A4_11605 [Silvanigrellaceae bacterium]
MNVFLQKFSLALLSVGLLILTPGITRADDELIIRGDQSVPLLSDVPLPVETSPEIFTVKPRRTPSDDLVSLLGNADLFLLPPEAMPFGSTARGDAGLENKPENANKNSAGDGQ